jgi:plasmid stabilization system protein ParE
LSHRLEIRPQALADIAEAAAWYEERQPGLGERSTREVVTAIDALSPNPLIYRLRNQRLGARWCFSMHANTWTGTPPASLPLTA